ncbi:MAG: hypothetical protein NVS3B20_24040 [Polyangiales bacterium]
MRMPTSTAAKTVANLPFSALAMATALIGLLSITDCSPSGGSSTVGSPQWPKSSSMSVQPLPPTVNWTGVYFINTPGSRGTMHLFLGESDKIHGCWLAEDRHAKATFVGKAKDNLAMLDWTQKRVGFAGAPDRVTAYLVLTPDAEGRHKVAGEYGSDLSNDAGTPWEGVRQKNQEPKEDGCKLERGDSLPSETKPLE